MVNDGEPSVSCSYAEFSESRWLALPMLPAAFLGPDSVGFCSLSDQNPSVSWRTDTAVDAASHDDALQ